MAGLCEGGNEPPGSLKAIKPKNHVNTKNRDDVKKLVKYFDTSTEEAKTFYSQILQHFLEWNQENNEAEYPEEPFY
ncbi:hypothetical protein ANN_19031 [Periplaneta americana]|uniref:Uncharacterized protein n=1 Tax=Periplaneta americana TaxID=6978 RepID=A0ABQ8SRH2_PERAM|nr:hypothetical protein ANN_19031 [Periplaneta americana]